MPKLYEFKGLGQFEFPDDASNEEIQSWVDQYASKKAGIIESFSRFPRDVAAAALSSTSSMLALGDPEPGEVGRGWDFEKEARRAEEKKAALQGGYAPGRGSGPSFGGTSDLFGQGYRSKIPSEQATTSDWLPEQFLKAPVTSGGGARGFDLPDQTREALKSEVEASREASRIGAAGEEVAQEIKDNAYGYSKPFIRDTLSSVGSVVPTALVGAISPGAAIGAAAAQAGGSKYLENKKRYEAQGIDPVEADRMARQDAVPSALITGGVTFGFGKLAKIIKKFKDAKKGVGSEIDDELGGGLENILNPKQSIRSAMAEEIGEEATNQALQLAVDKQRARPELTFGEALTEVLEAGAAGGFGAGVLKGSVKVAQKIFNKPEDKPKEKAVVDLVSNAAENAPVSSAVAAGMAQVADAPTDADLDAALEALKTPPPSSAAADQTTGTQGRVQPEPASTINAQVVLAADPSSTRKAVLLTPQDDGWEPNIPEGIDAVETKHGIVLYNPDKISEEEVVKAGEGETFDATILGLGTSERPGDQTPDQLVVATKDRTGVVVAETVTDGSPGQIQAVTDAHQQAVPGGTTSITTADETVRKRTLEIEAERLAAERGDGKRAGTPPVQAPVEPTPRVQTPVEQAPVPPPSAPNQRLRNELASAIEQSDIPSSMVDIVESDEEFDVAYDQTAKRFKVNLKKVQSPESVALKLHTHEKLHFVVDMLVEQGKEKEALKLIEDMAALAPDDLIRQINKYYSGDSRELTEEQAAYVAEALNGSFKKQGWFKTLTQMVGKVLSQVTGNKQAAMLVAAEMAAGRIQALSEEFIAQRKSGRIPKGSLKTSKSKTGIDAITATDDFGGLKRSDPRIRMAPTQRFGKEEGQLHEQQRINETFDRLLAQGHLSKDSPLNAANTELAHQTFQRFIDPVAGVSFAAEIREKTGVMGPGLLQVTLRLYADKMLASGDVSLRRALYEHQFLPEGAKPSDSAMEGAQRMRARQEYSSIVDDSLNYFKDTLPNEHLDNKNGAGIGPEVKQAVNNAVVNTTTTPEDISSPSGPTPRVKKAVETLNNIKPPVDETVDEQTDDDLDEEFDAEFEPEEEEEFEGDKIVKRWTNRIQLEQTEWLKPDEKIHEVELILRAALKDKTRMTDYGKLFRDELQSKLENAGVNELLAFHVAYEVHNKRLAAWSARRAKVADNLAKRKEKAAIAKLEADARREELEAARAQQALIEGPTSEAQDKIKDLEKKAANRFEQLYGPEKQAKQKTFLQDLIQRLLSIKEGSPPVTGNTEINQEWVNQFELLGVDKGAAEQLVWTIQVDRAARLKQSLDAKQAAKAKADAKRAEVNAIKRKRKERLARAREEQALIEAPTVEAQNKIDALLKGNEPKSPAEKSSLREQIKQAMSIKDGSDPITVDSFVTKWTKIFTRLGVDPGVASNLATYIANNRVGRFNEIQARRTASVAGGRTASGEFRKPDLWFLAKEILDAPVSQQLDPAWRKEVARRFYQKRGLAPDQVEAAIRLFEHVFTEKLAAAQFEAAKKALDGIRDQDGKITLDKSMDKLMRAIRSRLLDPSASFVEKLAEQFGFVSPLTHKQFNRLKKLDADLATTRSPRHMGMIFREKASIINAAKKPKLISVEGWKRFTERLQAYYTANALSSIGVFNANVVSPTPSTLFRLLFELPVSITKGSQAIDHMAGTVMIMVNAVKNAAIDLKFSAVKDTYQTLEYREVAEMSALADFMASGFRKLKSPNTSNLEKVSGSFEMAVGMVDVVRRIFSISDNFHQMIIRDFVEGIHIRDQAMVGKMTAQNATLLATGATIATERFQQEAASFGLTGLAADAYVGDRIRESVLKVYEDIGGDPVALQELAKNEAQLTTGNYMGVSKAKETGVSYDTGSPIGMGTDKLVESSEYLIHKLPVIGRMVGGFVRVVYNINEQTFNWTPAGLMRIGYRSVILNTFGIDTYKKSLGEAYQRRIVAQKATVGTLFMVAAAYLIWGGDDDDEWVIDVTSDSTITSLEFRNMLKTVGIRPGSFFMRNKKTGEVRTLKYNSAVMENFKWGGVIMGVIRDLERSGKLDFTDGRKMETFGLLVWNMLKGVADNSRNFGLGSVADLQGRLSSPKGWASFAGFSLSPFLPVAGLVSSVRRLFEDKPAHDTFRSSFFASFAYAPADERKPALNWLGEPINGTFQSTPERVAAAATLVGLPFSVQVPANDPSWPIYDLFFEKGATPPWYQIKDVEDRLGVPLTGDQWYEYVKKRGGLVRQKILRNLDALKRMNRDDVNSALGRYSKEALVEIESKMEKDITNTRKAKSKKVPELLKR